MRSKFLIPIFLLLTTNCYLTDLDDYKHLESHNEDYLYLNSNSTSSFYLWDSVISDDFSVNAHFSIKRSVYYSFFAGDDTSEPVPILKFTGENGKYFSEGLHNYTYTFKYNPAICTKFLTLQVRAISDVDTLESKLQIPNRMYFHCNKGGVDSVSLTIQFGNNSKFLSYISPVQYLTFTGIHLNPVVIIKFSKTYNKPFIMLLYNNTKIDSTYDFVRQDNLNSLMERATNSNSYFMDYNYGGSVDRNSLCDIWRKHYTLSSKIYEFSEGKQFALVCPLQEYNDFLVFLIKVNKITYHDSSSGDAECIIYTLN